MNGSSVGNKCEPISYAYWLHTNKIGQTVFWGSCFRYLSRSSQISVAFVSDICHVRLRYLSISN